MDEPDFSKLRVTILGLGLMGGSLALGLGGRCREVRAADPDPEVMELALKMGLVDRMAADLSEVLQDVDLVVLAAPVRANLELVKALPRLIPEGVVVLDLGSTKADICRELEELPVSFDPVGGHPMGGKERGGLENADAAIFAGATFALTALKRTSQRARAMAEGLARLLGSRPVWMEAEAHDRWAAATSHLPYLLANALALATPVEAAALVGSGFRSTSRLAASFTPMMLDVLMTNRENVLEAARLFRGELEGLEEALRRDDSQGLRDCLERSARRHQDLMEKSQGGEATA